MLQKTIFKIKGMTCGDCAGKLEQHLADLDGVSAVSAHFATASLLLSYDGEVINQPILRQAISACGYTALTDDDDVTASTFITEYFETIRVVTVAALLLFSWILPRFLGFPEMVAHVMQLLAVVVGGYSIFINAGRALLQKSLNVDFLVMIAATAAVSIGEFFEAGLVIFILLLGEFLEEVTVAKTGKAIKGLASLIPLTVKMMQDNQEIEIASSEVKVGNVIVVRPGENIAIDGIIVKGEATIDQALITGESIPVTRAVGDEVYSGTINKMGAIEVRATKVGRDTTVAKIEKMILESQAKKAPVERIVNRFAKYFVPAILLLAIIVYLITHDIHRAITILIVACPCALVLGTPTAVVAAIGAAARNGILIKGGEALEASGRIDGVIFDKTGTLTLGRPKVTSIKEVGKCGHIEDEIVQFAAAAERFSEHPLAGAILDRAKEREIVIMSPDDFKVKQGLGVEVTHDGMHIIVGNRGLLKDNKLTLTADLEKYMDDKERQAETALLLVHSTKPCNKAADTASDDCCPKEICAVLEMVDPPKEQAGKAVQWLRAGGVKLIALYTGDNPRTARTIARRVGVTQVMADLSPAAKADKIEQLKEAGHIVAMVGDGINDAPALAAANVGIAMGVVGSDIAVQAANIVILNDDILSVPRVVVLGKRSLSIIKQNLGFAVIFNTVMVALASYGIIGMIVAAVFHQVSSLVVILNSMRLLRGQMKLV